MFPKRTFFEDHTKVSLPAILYTYTVYFMAVSRDKEIYFYKNLINAIQLANVIQYSLIFHVTSSLTRFALLNLHLITYIYAYLYLFAQSICLDVSIRVLNCYVYSIPTLNNDLKMIHIGLRYKITDCLSGRTVSPYVKSRLLGLYVDLY